MPLIPTDEATVGTIALLFGNALHMDIGRNNDPVIGLYVIFIRYRDKAKSKVITPKWVEGLIRFLVKESLKAAPVHQRTRKDVKKAEDAYRKCLEHALHLYKTDINAKSQALATLCVLLAPKEDTEGAEEAMRIWDQVMALTDPGYKRSPMLEEIIKRAAHRTN